MTLIRKCSKEECEASVAGDGEKWGAALRTGWVAVKLRFINGVGANKEIRYCFCPEHSTVVKSDFFSWRMNRVR